MNSNSANSRSSPAPKAARRVRRGIILGVFLAGALLITVDIAGRLRAAIAARPQPVDDALALAMGVDDVRYVDPQRRFALTTPRGWVARTGPDIAPRSAVFRGPRNLEIWIEVEPMPYTDPLRLKADLQKIEEDLSLNTNITNILFKGATAYERQVRMFEMKVLAIDFLSGSIAHHLQAAAPKSRFESYEGLLRKILQTYEPGPVAEVRDLLDH